MPRARASGATVVIVNAEPTAMDGMADAVLQGSISELLPRLVAPATSSAYVVNQPARSART